MYEQVLHNGMVGLLDSEGICMVWSHADKGGKCMPVLDIKTQNKPRDWFWPIRLDEDNLTGVVCKIEKR